MGDSPPEEATVPRARICLRSAPLKLFGKIIWCNGTLTSVESEEGEGILLDDIADVLIKPTPHTDGVEDIKRLPQRCFGSHPLRDLHLTVEHREPERSKRGAVVLHAVAFHSVEIVEEEPEEEHPEEGKEERHRVFAEWLSQTFGQCLVPGSIVLDVAGGSGTLARLLSEMSGAEVSVVDPQEDSFVTPQGVTHLRTTAKTCLAPLIRQKFDNEFIEDQHALLSSCALLCGMHPDQATEVSALLR
jgi:hypothetical protein